MSGGRLIRDMKICNVEKSMNNQILLTGGRPNCKKGFLSVIRYGLKIRSIISINCAIPVGVWAVKKHAWDKFHTYIVLSLSSRKTHTFIYDPNKLTRTDELKLDDNELTMNVSRFGDNSLVQVAAFRLKYINKEGNSRDYSIRGRVMKATAVPEGRQLMLSMVGGFIEYLEVSGNELKKIKEMQIDAEANIMEFSPP
jgi:hypothetical protein